MNPNDEIQRGRLFKAIEVSYRQLEPFRKLVVGLVEEYAGPGYGHQGGRPKYETLVNLMNQAVDAYTMSLAANRPRVVVSTPHDQLKFFGKMFEVSLNNLIQEIELETVMRQAVLDAFFCVGVVKVHMADSAQVQLEEGVWMDPGSPFASNVSLDNWVHDMSANEYQKVKFAGDTYRLPFEDMQSDIFDQEVVRRLTPSSKYTVDTDRVDAISKGYETDLDEYEPMIDLMDVWIPKDGKIYTFPIDMTPVLRPKGKPVAVMPWNGPEFGPYKILSYNDVPGNIMPASPASHLAGLARLANNLLRKQKRQANRQKDVYTYTPGASDSAKKIQRTDDGEWVEVQDKNDVGVLKMGGVDPGNQAFFIGVLQMFDRMAGNLQAMAGLGPQAPTATQEKLIYGSVSKKEAQMQYRTIDFTRRVVRDLGHMLWNDVVKTISGQIGIEGTDYSAQIQWTPEDREGDFFDYNIDIDVYSMSYQSPGQRVQALTQLLTSLYLPMQQIMAQQGGQIDFQKMTEVFSNLLNLPQLKDIVKFAAPSEFDTGPHTRTSPLETMRTHIRQNVATGGTPQNQAAEQQQAWLTQAGGQQQPQADMGGMAA